MLNIAIMVILDNIICIFAIVTAISRETHYQIDDVLETRISIELIDRFNIINGSIRDIYSHWGHRSSPNI